MTTWTHTARQTLETYFARIRGGLAASGADPAEVTDDLRRHLDDEIAARNMQVVTEEDVNALLSRIGAPEPALVPQTKPEPSKAQSTPAKAWHPLLFLFGFFLPALTLGIELFTHASASLLFDPIPTLWHAALVSLVPATNLAAWWTLRERKITWGWLAIANGFAIVIAGFYSLLYLPIVPFAIVGILWIGIGFLPLSPLLSFIAALRLRYHLRKSAPAAVSIRPLLTGMGLALVALALIVLPGPATRYWAQLASSEDSAVRSRGIYWLRALGDENILLRDCYGRPRGDSFNLSMLGQPLPAEKARELYFRLTGRAFNTMPPPQRGYSTGGWERFDDFTWDADRGGETVAGRLRGLWLVNSRMDSLVEAEPALSYLEWILEFRNDSADQQEARAQIALPPGGVVSRLTLWVNGEEREAAFAGRAQVREAYQKVAIQQRRDPVLVTSCGPDRVLMQCFPVPPNGGTMKVRLGITAPLLLEEIAAGAMSWPHFLERNFSLPDNFTHSLWAQATHPLIATDKKLLPQASKAHFSLHGNLSDSSLAEHTSVIRVQRPAELREFWTRAKVGDSSALIRQSISERRAPAATRVVIVLDGSAAMTDSFPAIARALARYPEQAEVSLLLASDDVVELSGPPEMKTAEALRRLRTRVSGTRGKGGQDNIPALIRGWELAAASEEGVVLWIHAPQPVILQSAEGLRQKLEWRQRRPLLYDFQIGSGANRIAEALDGLGAVRPVSRLGTVEHDLEKLLATVTGRTPVLESLRVKSDAEPPPPSAKEGSRHLARLWASEEVLRLKVARKLKEAVQLAGQFQLVTAVSGAVVLETAEQFQQAGLQPVSAETVPAVPEPSTLLLLGVGCVCALLVYRRRASGGPTARLQASPGQARHERRPGLAE